MIILRVVCNGHEIYFDSLVNAIDAAKELGDEARVENFVADPESLDGGQWELVRPEKCAFCGDPIRLRLLAQAQPPDKAEVKDDRKGRSHLQ